MQETSKAIWRTKQLKKTVFPYYIGNAYDPKRNKTKRRLWLFKVTYGPLHIHLYNTQTMHIKLIVHTRHLPCFPIKTRTLAGFEPRSSVPEANAMYVDCALPPVRLHSYVHIQTYIRSFPHYTYTTIERCRYVGFTYMDTWNFASRIYILSATRCETVSTFQGSFQLSQTPFLKRLKRIYNIGPRWSSYTSTVAVHQICIKNYRSGFFFALH
jgi:hypothetical protein